MSPTKLRIGVPIAEGAFPIYREQLLECSLSRGALMRQVVLWAADGGAYYRSGRAKMFPPNAHSIVRLMRAVELAHICGMCRRALYVFA